MKLGFLPTEDDASIHPPWPILQTLERESLAFEVETEKERV